MKKLIELINIGKTYRLGKLQIPALKKINLTIHKSEFLGIIGPSGSGKSTLLHLIGLMDKPNHGTIRFQDADTKTWSEAELAKARMEKIGFVFQDFNLLDDLSVEENIALPLLIKSGKNHLSKTEKEKLENLLEKLDLLKRRKHKPRQISGGQKQRTAIARALISEPELLLADEPTGNLDQNTGKQIIEILHNLCTEDKITMIIVTHDQKIAQKAHRVIQLEEGQMSKRLHTKKILG